MEEEVAFNDYVKSAFLPKPNEDCGNLSKQLDVSGWGWNDHPGPGEPLLSVKQRCLSPELCERGSKFDEESEICAGDLGESGNGPCGGDSGGKC